jgi:hypothetical protein
MSLSGETPAKKPIDHYRVQKGSMDKTSPNYTTGCHRDYHYRPITLGWVKRSGTSSPSLYTGITTVNEYCRHIITITKDHAVAIDGLEIARAPAHKTKAQKEKFCKAVVLSLTDDNQNFREQLARLNIPEDLAMPDTIEPAIQYSEPVIISQPAGWIPYLRLSITEEALA